MNIFDCIIDSSLFEEEIVLGIAEKHNNRGEQRDVCIANLCYRLCHELFNTITKVIAN